MERERAGRRPYSRKVRPPEDHPPRRDPLPPSARLYGTPAPPSHSGVPRWVRPALVATLAVAAVAGLVGAVVTVVTRLTAPAPPVTVTDGVAGVVYRLPEGWHEGKLAPVSAFTSVVSDGRRALVMVRAGPPLKEETARDAAVRLAELYSRLLLHGDRVQVEDDRPVTLAGFRGHGRALRAQYTDVVNRPAHLRVVVADRGASTLVLLAVVQPDDARTRADVDAIVNELAASR
ncbi:hypothetical protein [Thermostaphylospora chromogena]|uniref:Uncharacterized protein n=1 Tax=Thermostaphylospora chromogena TaxID=35622 RepID=A0A1H1F4S7_9ACTN|nr:hypothetical protein [Thermostaphylospora chromogena]SDQ95799.1 hypothetical protein SAMN04489764_2780 [Thermostaphylospora chromogena]